MEIESNNKWAVEVHPMIDDMGSKKIALIGHSGAGKSAVLCELGLDVGMADMDAVLGVKRSPTLQEAMNWLTNRSAGHAIVVVSNHEEMLKAIWRAKNAGQHQREFAQICFTYLHKPRERLARHLEKPTACGHTRPVCDQQYTLKHYDRFHCMFVGMADRTIDCSAKHSREIGEELKRLLYSLREPRR